ncbi:MAG: hydrogenase expression/formation C-terminal domain-containing protein [Solirubrobacteraceae bacterium]
MTRLAEIPIRIEPPASDGGLGGGVAAILNEIVRLLERLASLEEPAAIDLRSLPMSPKDRTELQRVLGEGEVQATLNAEGISRIHETRVPGVWWVEHRDRHGAVIAELIEVTRVPQILASAPEEIAAGARALREQVAAGAAARAR